MKYQTTTQTQSKKKKNNAMKKIGKSIKDTFVEMSSSLAGWIDDVGEQFNGKKSTKQSSKTTQMTQTKTTSSSEKS